MWINGCRRRARGVGAGKEITHLFFWVSFLHRFRACILTAEPSCCTLKEVKGPPKKSESRPGRNNERGDGGDGSPWIERDFFGFEIESVQALLCQCEETCLRGRLFYVCMYLH